MTTVDDLPRGDNLSIPVDPSIPVDAAKWRDTLDAYSTTLQSQRAYLEAVSNGVSDAEPPAPFEVPNGLPASTDAIRRVIADLHAETMLVLAEHGDLPDQLERPFAGAGITRRSTTTAVPVLDRAL